MRPGAHLPAIGMVVVLLAACATAPDRGADRAGSGTAAGTPTGELTVFAAASLTDAFDVLGRRFEERNPSVDVTFNFAGSATLSTQLVQGAPGDVFAAADSAQMDDVADAGLTAAAPTVLTTNRLQIAVERGNPHDIRGLADLDRADLIVVLAAPQVPAGGYAQQALDAAAVDVEPASLEPDVRAVLARVRLGEADAGIVYRSDIVAAGATVDGIDIPSRRNVVASYPIATLAGASNPATARAFVEFVTSEEGEATLRRFGFTAWSSGDDGAGRSA